MEDKRGPGRHRPLTGAPSPLCWICGQAVGLGGYRVMINSAAGVDRPGWICEECERAMCDACPVCSGEGKA
jgi:hypothetical protein